MIEQYVEPYGTGRHRESHYPGAGTSVSETLDDREVRARFSTQRRQRKLKVITIVKFVYTRLPEEK